ncbi:MAG TPA: tRNA-dihydrouridine synthase [Cellvibrionaceae bacterium]
MRILMAPMEGVVDPYLRALYCQIGGIDLFVTEFIRVTHTLLPSKLFRRLCPELAAPLTTPVRVQLLGSDSQALSENAQRAAMLGAPGIDLNFGCPAKTVNKHRGGACLLREPATLFDIVRSVRKATPSHIPVTAKMRLGYLSREGYVENALAIAEAGAQELVVHGRSKADGYKPPAFWDSIGEIQAALKIPVVANGDIWSLQDFIRCRAESGCNDVMLGRPLLAKPDLALQIKSYLTRSHFSPMNWETIVGLVWQYHLNTLPDHPSKHIGNRLKQWLMYLQRDYPQAGLLFEQIKKLRDAASLETAFAPLLESAKKTKASHLQNMAAIEANH